jgi:hypothetical protein
MKEPLDLVFEGYQASEKPLDPVIFKNLKNMSSASSRAHSN